MTYGSGTHLVQQIHVGRDSTMTYVTVPTLSNRHMRAAAAAQGKAHNLPLGEYEEHDEGLDADSDDNDDSNTGQLLTVLRGRQRRRLTLHYSKAIWVDNKVFSWKYYDRKLDTGIA
jgi:hypothetical protein